MSTLHVYRINDGDQHWYIAASVRKALAAYVKDHSAGPSVVAFLKEYPETKVDQLDDSQILSINQEEINGAFKPVRHRCSTWAKQGAGFLCTTIW